MHDFQYFSKFPVLNSFFPYKPTTAHFATILAVYQIQLNIMVFYWYGEQDLYSVPHVQQTNL
jgi:hypothetical protein